MVPSQGQLKQTLHPTPGLSKQMEGVIPESTLASLGPSIPKWWDVCNSF